MHFRRDLPNEGVFVAEECAEQQPEVRFAVWRFGEVGMMHHFLDHHGVHAPYTAAPSVPETSAQLLFDLLGQVTEHDLHFLEQLGDRFLHVCRFYRRSGFSVRKELADVLSEGMHLPSDGLLPRISLWVAPNQLEDELGKGILIVTAVLKTGRMGRC